MGSHRDRGSTGLQELPDKAWDYCEGVFKDWLEDKKYRTLGIAVYPDDLQKRFNILLESFNPTLSEADIDIVALHYRTRRFKKEVDQAWIRVVQPTKGGFLKEEWRDKKFYEGWHLQWHAFDKAKENGILLVVFPEAGAQTDITEGFLSVPSQVADVLIHHVGEILSEGDERRKITPEKEEQIKNAIEKQEGGRDFLNYLNRFCQDSLSEEDFPLEVEEHRLAFLIESSLITLTLLTREGLMEEGQKSFQKPRSFLLAPIFVGQERVGGVAFLSGNASGLSENRAILKTFARNVLAYVSLLEGQEVEIDRRLLETMGPVTHLFIHSFNKAFTTPILNICDELEFMPQSSGDARERVKAISCYMRSFARRWAGTFPAMMELFPTERRGPERTKYIPRFGEIGFFEGKEIKNELKEHVQALFAVYLSNDIFDYAEFKHYRSVLKRMEALNHLVPLEIDLRHRIPGQRDIIMLHLLNLIQNSLEALPLESTLWHSRKTSARISPRHKICVRSQEEHDAIVIEIEDNGRGFDEKVRENLQEFLNEFATSTSSPTVWEIQDRIRRQGILCSTKSGEAYGGGLLATADYVSRICRVRWFPENEQEAYGSFPDDGAEILKRGRVVIENLSLGSIVKIVLPAGLTGLNIYNGKGCEEIFMERR